MYRPIALIGLLAIASCDGVAEPVVAAETSALSTTFHRMLHDDPPGGCDTRDYTGDGDWYPNYCKTECAAPLTGLSSSFPADGNCSDHFTVAAPLDPGPGPGPDPGSPVNYHWEEFTHVMACSDNTSPAVVLGTGYTLHFASSDDRRSPNIGTAWGGGLFTGECDNFSAMVGVATDHYWHGDGACSSHGASSDRRAYGIIGARCSTLASPAGFTTQALNCQVVDFSTSSVNEAGGGTSFVGTDWDFGYHKGECGDGRFVKGIAHRQRGTGSESSYVAKILCCSTILIPN